ncbi:MAG: hypothetical protein B7Z15_08195 [Rhizobiales bacterium 32-66-8]|nr:MAG: hypothetical protein B7Z15_08195 [Rhizobiales bacterium 32-66-8]
MKISGKIYSIVAVLGLTTVISCGVAFNGMRHESRLSERLDEVSQRAFLTERLNGLVTSVVMEARGIYAAADVDKAKPFAAGILRDLESIDKLVVRIQGRLGNEGAAFEPVARDLQGFKVFRTETARLGVTEGPRAANVQGNNEANRANRKDLQASIIKFTELLRNELEPLRDEADATRSRTATTLISVTVVGLLVGIGIALLIGTRLLSRPLVRVSQTLQRLAQGDLNVEMATNRPKDEIGDLCVDSPIVLLGGHLEPL